VQYSLAIHEAQTKNDVAYIFLKWLDVPGKVGSGPAVRLIKRSDEPLLTGKTIGHCKIARGLDTKPKPAERVGQRS
jgi:hypothetical protein